MDRFQRGLEVATGSADAARREFGFVSNVARDLGLNLESTADAYTGLAAAARGTALEGQSTRDVFLGVSQASRALGLSAEQTRGALRAVEQIISKGTVQAEELRGQLGERLPGAFQIAARAIGVTTEELNKMLEQGEVIADEFLPRFADQLQKEFSEKATQAAQDAAASFERLRNSIFELKVSIANSGVLDALASFSDGIRKLIGGATVEEDIARVRAEIERLKDSFREAGGLGDVPDEILRPLREELIELIKVQSQSIPGVTVPTVEFVEAGEAIETARQRLVEFNQELRTESAENFEKALQRFSDRFETAEQKAQRLRAQLNLFYNDLTEGQRALVEAEIDDILFGDLQEIDLSSLPQKRITEPFKQAFDETQGLAERFSRNMGFLVQNSFFTPTKRGLDGLVQSFGAAFAQIVAEAAASKFISFITGLFGGAGGGLSTIDLASLPRRRGLASGGLVSAGENVIVGENGPEVFRPRKSGAIIPNGAGFGETQVNIFNAPPGTEVRSRNQGGLNIQDIILPTLMSDLAANGQFSQAMQGAFPVLNRGFRS